MASNGNFQTYVEIYKKEPYQGQVSSTGDKKVLLQSGPAILDFIDDNDAMSTKAKALELTIEHNLTFNGIVSLEGSLDHYEFHVRRNFNNMILEPISYPIYLGNMATIINCQEKEDVGYDKNTDTSMGVW